MAQMRPFTFAFNMWRDTWSHLGATWACMVLIQLHLLSLFSKRAKGDKVFASRVCVLNGFFSLVVFMKIPATSRIFILCLVWGSQKKKNSFWNEFLSLLSPCWAWGIFNMSSHPLSSQPLGSKREKKFSTFSPCSSSSSLFQSFLWSQRDKNAHKCLS